MTEPEAKKHLRRMLRSFTAGSVLHLLAEVHVEPARRANQSSRSPRQRKLIADTLIVLGLGIDAAIPR